MFDFEDFAKQKQKNMLVACVILVIAFIVFGLFDIDMLPVAIITPVLFLYIFYCMSYGAWLGLFTISRKVSENVQRRAQILQKIKPYEDEDNSGYAYLINPILRHQHFVYEQDIQDMVAHILDEYDISDEKRKALTDIQKEISGLLRMYKHHFKFIFDQYTWWKWLYYRKFNPMLHFFGDEDIEFFKR